MMGNFCPPFADKRQCGSMKDQFGSFKRQWIEYLLNYLVDTVHPVVVCTTHTLFNLIAGAKLP